MSASRDGGILIFDLEGTDSKERGEQRLVRRPIHYSHLILDFRADYLTVRAGHRGCPHGEPVDDGKFRNPFSSYRT